eukprot:4356047-Pleurochrysis_carterae.AAC.2
MQEMQKTRLIHFTKSFEIALRSIALAASKERRVTDARCSSRLKSLISRRSQVAPPPYTHISCLATAQTSCWPI